MVVDSQDNYYRTGKRAVRAGVRSKNGEEGLTLVEMMIAMFVLSLVLIGVAAGLSTSLNLTRNNEARGAAASLASQEIESIQAMEFGDILAELGVDGPNTVTLGDVPFEVTRNIYWVSRSAPGGVCGGIAGAGDANFLRIDASVTWPAMGSTQPVTSETTIAPPVGLFNPNLGSLAVYVSDHQVPPVGVQGVAVTITGPTEPGTTTTTATVQTGADGCAIFDGLEAGTYDISLSKPGHIDLDQRVAPNVTGSQGVPAGKRAEAAFKYAPVGKMRPVLQGRDGGLLPQTPLEVAVATTRDVYRLPASSTSPLTLDVYPESYESFAGSCPDADPLGSSDPTSPGNEYWPGAARGAATQIPPTVPTDAPTILASLDIVWDAALDRDATYRLEATHIGECTGGTSVLDFGSIDLDDVSRLALPWGTWRLTLYDGSTQVAEGTSPALDPRRGASDPVPSVDVVESIVTCTPQTPRIVSSSEAAGRDPGGPSSYDITTPSGTATGDLLLISVTGYNASSWAVPAGFTQIGLTTADRGMQLRVFARKLTAPAPSTVRIEVNGWVTVQMQAFRGVGPATPTVSSTFSEAAPGRPIPVPSVSVLDSNSLAVAYTVSEGQTNISSLDGWSFIESTWGVDGNDSSVGSRIETYWERFNAGATGVMDFAVNGGSPARPRTAQVHVFAPECVS